MNFESNKWPNQLELHYVHLITQFQKQSKLNKCMTIKKLWIFLETHRKQLIQKSDSFQKVCS